MEFYWVPIFKTTAALILGLGIISLTVHFRRREERRLASGWKLVPNESRLVKNLEAFGTFLFGLFCGAQLAEEYHISYAYFLLAYWILTLITPRSKWVPPAHESGSASESMAGGGQG
jgi:hypothetical protein